MKKPQMLKILILSVLLLCGCTKSPETKSILVNDWHYISTGSTGEVTKGYIFEPDGTITTTVDSSKTPYLNDQSNFGTGYEYDIVADDTVYVHMNDKWIKFIHDPSYSDEVEGNPDGGEYKPHVLIHDHLYGDTGEADNDGNHEVNGIINSTVDQTELPFENDQSNFGLGYEYDYIDEDYVYVHINGKWIKYQSYVNQGTAEEYHGGRQIGQ